MTKSIYLLLGSNLGDRKSNLRKARNEIAIRAGKIIGKSALYETAPWGVTEQPQFLNQVVQLESTLPPRYLLEELLQIETFLGRERIQKWESRIIDIDILLYDHEVVNSHQLTIPHPHLHERRFTLLPLSEIAPDFIHPILQKSITELLKGCPDQLHVSVFKDDE